MRNSLFLLFALTMLYATAQGQSASVNCKPLAGFFSKNICSSVENNKAFLVKDQLQKRSNEQSLAGLQRWTREHYICIRCEKDAGFDGGTLMRKVVFDNALTVAFFLVYDVRVDMNFIEIDGRTLLDWLRDDTEKTFDAAFETESASDKQYLLKQLQINQKYHNLFINNGAKFRHQLEAEARRTAGSAKE
ncbi:MAG: hypothetical protein K9J06_05160 [Flavobacteriales bacterium]|nr:hypothetical protein [Flavobacteriales bacterium]